MTRDDLRILCTALGFSAVIANDVASREKQALRATAIAGLIEAFCMSAVPDAFGFDASDDIICDATAIDREIDRYKEELRVEGSAELPQDRETLIKFYDRLLLRKEHYDQREFYASGSTAIFANRVLHMVEEEINCDKERGSA